MSKLFLLSREEYEKNKEYIQSESHWWLRTPRHNPLWRDGSDMCYVHSDGDICYAFAYFGDIGVRPALKFDLDPYTREPLGSIIHYGKLDWIKLKNNIYLSKDIVFNYKFNGNDNDTDYNNSDIKKKLKECESWWFTEEELSMLKDVQ